MEKHFDLDFANDISTVTIMTLEQRTGESETRPIVVPYNESKDLITKDVNYKLIEKADYREKQLSHVQIGYTRQGEFFYHYLRPKQQPKG